MECRSYRYEYSKVTRTDVLLALVLEYSSYSYRGVQAPGGSGEKPSVAPLNLKKYFEKKKCGS